jgi:two-component system, cell cycle response regulator
MEDLPLRRLQALSAHVRGLEAALAALEVGESSASPRRLVRSLARAADDLDLPEVAARAREARARPDAELGAALRALLDFIAAEAPPTPEDDARHVLLVEDDRTFATAALAYLEAEGRVLHHAATASEAEQMLAAHPVDLVILDLILPDRDGRDLLLQLRENPDTATVPVIVLSPRAARSTRSECLAVGASGFLEKPADPKVLGSAASLLLSEHGHDENARLDPTTGILSRAGITETFGRLRSRTGRVKGPVAVAVVSVAPFDRILRERGREAGALMKTLASNLRLALGPRDRLGRWSVAEVLVLMPGTSPQAARARVEEGLSRLPDTGLLDQLQGSGIELSFAAGIAIADSGAGLREAAFAAERAAVPARREGSRFTLEAAPEPVGPLRVLLVENDRVMAALIQHRLVREGFDVMDFLNGEDAYLWASRGSFDVAILDVKVPGMGGFEILERLRTDPRHAHVPIIMLARLGSEADVVRGLELGANDYMLKPFSPAELLARVRRLAVEATGSRTPGTTEGPSSEAR